MTFIIVLMLLAGIGIMLYPTFSNWYNSLHQSKAIADYNQVVSSNDDSRNEELWNEAIAYNEELAKTGVNFRLSMYNAEITDGSTAPADNNATAEGAEGTSSEGNSDAGQGSNTGTGTNAAETDIAGTDAAASAGSSTDDDLAAARQQYEETLDVSGTGIMGYIDIDKVNIHLPIYHDTSESVLQIAVGHIAGTSLPVGGESSHCVLTGHTGLPSARLFTDIDQLEEGDIFQLVVLDHTLTYEVDDIRVVLPNEVDSLQIEDGKDLCTLVTCTPYGINTHRLLVTGHRVSTPAADNIQQTPPSQTWQEEKRSVTIRQIVPFVVGAAVVLVLLLWLLHVLRKKHKAAGNDDGGPKGNGSRHSSKRRRTGRHTAPEEKGQVEFSYDVDTGEPYPEEETEHPFAEDDEDGYADEHELPEDDTRHSDEYKSPEEDDTRHPDGYESPEEDDTRHPGGYESPEEDDTRHPDGYESPEEDDTRHSDEYKSPEEDDAVYSDEFDPAEEDRRLSFLELPYPDLKTPEEQEASEENDDPAGDEEDDLEIVHLDDWKDDED